MHYYQFNIGDYTSHTRGLSLLEDLAYRRLIDECYLSERPLNGCSTDVARIIGFAEHVDAVEYVLGRFFTETDDGWVHERIENDIKRFHDKQNKAAKAGKASAVSRSKAKKKLTVATDVEQTLNGCSTDAQRPSTNQEPITNNQEPIAKTPCPPPADSVTDLFVEFWSVYPRKTKRADAEKAFRKLKPDRALTETLIDDIGRRLVAGAWIADGDERQFIPHPTTYLNGKRWNDEIIPRQGVPNGSHQPGYQPRKLTPAERTEQARQAALRRDATGQSSDLGAVEAHGGNVRPLLGQSTR